MWQRFVFGLVLAAFLAGTAAAQQYRMQESEGRSAPQVPVTLNFIGAPGDYFAPNLHPIVDGVPTACQLDVRSTWPDGSIAHALLTFLVDVSPYQSWTVTFGRSSFPVTGPFTVRWGLMDALKWRFDVEELNGISSYLDFDIIKAWQLLYATAKGIRLSQDAAYGPLLREYEWIYRPLRSDRAVHKNIEVVVRWRLYSNWMGAFTEFIVENCRIDTPMDDLEYTSLEVTAGRQYENVVTQLQDAAHLFQTRFAAEHWAGSQPPEIRIQPDLNYLARMGLLPPLDATQPITEGQADRFITHMMKDTSRGTFDPSVPLGVPFDHGPLFQYMPGAGNRHDIGWCPRWAYYALNGTSDTGRRVTEAADMNASGAYPVHFRDPATRELGLRHSNPWWTQMQFKPRFSNPNVPNTAHAPLLGFTSYLLTGRKIFLEELVSWTCRGLRDFYPNSGVVQKMGDRKAAWALRNLVLTNAVLPDRHPLRGYLRTQLDKTAANWGFKLDRTLPLGTYGTGAWSGSGRPTWPCGKRVSPWMNAWFSAMCWSGWKLHGHQELFDNFEHNWGFFQSGYLTTDSWVAPTGELVSADPRLLMQYSKLVSTYTPEIQYPSGKPAQWGVKANSVVRLTNWAATQWYERIQTDYPVKSVSNPPFPSPSAAPFNWRPRLGFYTPPPASNYDEYGPGRVALLWIAEYEQLPEAAEVLHEIEPWIESQLQNQSAPHAPGTRFTGAAYQ